MLMHEMYSMNPGKSSKEDYKSTKQVATDQKFSLDYLLDDENYYVSNLLVQFET